VNDDERAQLQATEASISSYFAAASQVDIDAAETALRARSAGAVEHGANVHTSPPRRLSSSVIVRVRDRA